MRPRTVVRRSFQFGDVIAGQRSKPSGLKFDRTVGYRCWAADCSHMPRSSSNAILKYHKTHIRHSRYDKERSQRAFAIHRLSSTLQTDAITKKGDGWRKPFGN